MAYPRINWVDGELGGTPLDADNLNHMEDGIVANEEAIEEVSEIVEGKQDALTFDDAPTTGSNNPVKSGGIKTALDTKVNNTNPTSTGTLTHGTNSDAEGHYGSESVAIGKDAKALGMNSFAVGNGTKTSNAEQVVLGNYNEVKSTPEVIIGVGSADNNRKNAAEFYSNGDTIFGGEVTDGNGEKLSDKMDASDIDEANVRGAFKLLSSSPVTEKVPYNFRRSGGKVGGVALLNDKLIGGSLAFNQKVKNGNFANTSDWVVSANISFTVSGNVATVEKTNGGGYPAIRSDFDTIPAGHVLLFSIDTSASTVITGPNTFAFFGYNGTSKAPYIPVTYNTDWSHSEMLVKFTDPVNQLSVCYSDPNTTWVVGDKMYAKNVMFIDLTQMLGSTIADYIYGLGNTDGIALFRSLFPDNYYAYNSGELMSVNVSAHKMTGKNLVFKTISECNINASGVLESNNSYAIQVAYLKGGVTYTLTSDENRFVGGYFSSNPSIGSSTIDNTRIVSNSTTITPSNDCWVAFRTYNNFATPQIEVGSIATTYEPYKEYNYPLDDSLVLRGVWIKDANNNLYCDGDEYESDGTVLRKYGELNKDSAWTYSSGTSAGGLHWVDIDGLSKIGGMGYCDILPMDNWNGWISTTPCVAISNASSRIRVYGNFTSLADFKTQCAGIHILYELTTPTTETAEPFTNPQIVDANGMEEYVDARTVAIPVGHESKYTQALDLPALPSTDGDYTLKATISSGAVVFSWDDGNGNRSLSKGGSSEKTEEIKEEVKKEEIKEELKEVDKR